MQEARRRDTTTGERDRVTGDQRDRAGDERDRVADQRDQAGGQRDHIGDQRDRAADARDEAAERSEESPDEQEDAGVLSPSALARREAAADRKEASADRGAAAAERSDAWGDRDTAAADRGAGASRRSRSEVLEEALRRATVEADQANQAKSEFLTTMTHELRTPLNAVIGLCGLLLGTSLHPAQREYAEMARASGEELLAVINDILDFSKIEAGRIELEEIDFELGAVAEEALDLVAVSAHAKGLEVAALVDPDIPSGLRGDPGRLRQVMINLLANGVKFTPEGEVVVRVRLVGESGDSVDVRVEVSDTGIGIAAEQCAGIFESFSQGDASTSRRYGGTGLGLAISKRLVGLFGGEIGVDSGPGRGSTFWFTARLGRAQVLLPFPWEAGTDLDGLRVLVVDDQTVNGTVLEHILHSWRARPSCVGDGPEALAVLRAAADAGQPFDVVILGRRMPVMDGPDLAVAIRADDRIPTTPVALLTSSRDKGDIEGGRPGGVQALLGKPVRRSSLFDCLTALTGSGRVPVVGDVTSPFVADGGLMCAQVLVVEDSVANQMVASRMLETMGYRADVAANGLEAIEASARIPYAAILMDCQMPEMDGYEATGVIRRREGAGRRTPIIAMTAGVDEDQKARCIEAGMDDYLPKPVRPAELLSLLQRLTGHVDAGPRPGSSEARSPGPLLETALDALKRLAGKDRDGMTALVRCFLTETRARLDTLRARRGDNRVVARTAHMLSGGCATFAAADMAALCREIEQASAAAGFQVTEAALDRLDEEYGRVAAALGRAFRL